MFPTSSALEGIRRVRPGFQPREIAKQNRFPELALRGESRLLATVAFGLSKRQGGA